MFGRWKAAFVLGALLCWSAPAAQAQCGFPDGLDGGPCCAQTLLTIPKTKFSHQALGICWQNCTISAINGYTAAWGFMQPPGIGPGGAPCGWFRVAVSLSVGGVVHWRGNLNAVYARDWVEVAPTGLSYQVWRFLVNGDLGPTAAAGGPPCPVPPCAFSLATPRVRFTGYVDYANECGTINFEHAWMLTHSCDSIDHAPGFPRAGVFHPDRTYTFVGPAAGFVPGAAQPIEAGGAGPEHMRRWRVAPPGAVGVTCEFEDPITNAAINPLTQLCQCVNGPPQYQRSDLFMGSTCGASLGPPPGGPGFLSMGIGMWTLPGTYPGVEHLRWNTGTYRSFNPCSGVALITDYWFGVTTLQGWQAFRHGSAGVGPPLPLTFVDQCQSLLTPINVPTRNVPYWPEQMFSLNLP